MECLKGGVDAFFVNADDRAQCFHNKQPHPSDRGTSKISQCLSIVCFKQVEISIP